MKPAIPFLGAALAAVSAPAFAHHPTSSGVGGSAASINLLSPSTLEKGRLSAGFSLSYINPDRRSDDELIALAGQHIHAHDSDYGLNAAFGIAYGLTDRLTLSAELPYVWRENLRAGEHSHVGGFPLNQVERIGSVSGIGDASLLAKYKLAEKGGTTVAVIAGLKLPTGSSRKQSDEGELLETEHQPGSGSWDPMIGAAMETDLGTLRLSASAIYHFSTTGAQDTKLGDRASAGIALSHRFGPTPHQHEEGEHHHDGEEASHHHAKAHRHSSWDAFIELTGDWEGRQTIAGEVEDETGGKSVWLTPGVRFNSAKGWSAAVGIGLPLWQDIGQAHPDNAYRMTLAIGRGF